LVHFETAIITYVRSFRIQSLSPLKKRIQELNTNIIKELNESYKEAGIQEAQSVEISMAGRRLQGSLGVSVHPRMTGQLLNQRKAA